MQSRPFELAGMAAYRSRAAWDAAAVEILGTVLTRWRLTAGTSFTGGYSGAVLRVTTADGSPAVLKVGYPHPEAVAEAIGLEAMGAEIAPRVYRQDTWAWAMLLEELRPGEPLSAARLPTGESLDIGGALLARIAATGPVHGMPTLAETVGGYADVARSRMPGQRARLLGLGVRDLVIAAIEELVELADGGFDTAFVHGDFNPGNILRSASGWSVVDPKPMIGDPAYDLWPLVGQLGTPFRAADPAAALADQLTRAATAAGVDPVRATRWAFARSGLNVTWYLEEQNQSLAAQDAEELKAWATLRAAVTT